MISGNSGNSQLFSLFDEMINGHLQPHLLRDDDCSEIDKVLEDQDHFDDEWTHYEYVFEGDDYENFPIWPKSKEKLAELLRVIPYPPTQKANKYLIKTGAETRKIKSSIELFIEKSAPAAYENYAQKNITKLRLLAEQLRKYIQTLGGEQIYLFNQDTNHFIAHVLKMFIIDLILFIQRVFDLEISSSSELRMKLFEEAIEHIELSKIIPFLPKDAEPEACNVYLSKLVEYIQVKLNAGMLASAEDLFRFYKEKYDDLGRESRLKSFQEELAQWETFGMINSCIAKEYGDILNEPGLEKKLIPLLQKEIDAIENEDNKETGKNTTFTTRYDQAQLNQIRKRLIAKKMIKDISQADFEYLFTSNPVIPKMKRLFWAESRSSGHEFLRRVVYDDRQFDFNQVNQCIKFSDGKLLDSNCRSKAQYKNDDLFKGMV
jgi:hypothetical protein